LPKLAAEARTLLGFGGLPKTGEPVQLNAYQSSAARENLAQFGIKFNRGQILRGQLLADGDVAIMSGNPAERGLRFGFDNDKPADFMVTHQFRLKGDGKGYERALDFNTVQNLTGALRDSGIKLKSPVNAWELMVPGTSEAVQLRPISGPIGLNIDG